MIYQFVGAIVFAAFIRFIIRGVWYSKYGIFGRKIRTLQRGELKSDSQSINNLNANSKNHPDNNPDNNPDNYSENFISQQPIQNIVYRKKLQKKRDIFTSLFVFLITIISTFILSLLIIGPMGASVFSGLIYAFLLWFAFIVPTILARKIYDVNNIYSWEMFWIDTIYELVALMCASLVLAWFI